jgi:hypothetical protein
MNREGSIAGGAGGGSATSGRWGIGRKRRRGGACSVVVGTATTAFRGPEGRENDEVVLLMGGVEEAEVLAEEGEEALRRPVKSKVAWLKLLAQQEAVKERFAQAVALGRRGDEEVQKAERGALVERAVAVAQEELLPPRLQQAGEHPP